MWSKKSTGQAPALFILIKSAWFWFDYPSNSGKRIKMLTELDLFYDFLECLSRQHSPVRTYIYQKSMVEKNTKTSTITQHTTCLIRKKFKISNCSRGKSLVRNLWKSLWRIRNLVRLGKKSLWKTRNLVRQIRKRITPRNCSEN